MDTVLPPGTSDGQQGACELDKELVRAAGRGHVEEVKKLLEHKGNLETVLHSRPPQTPLSHAAEQGHDEVVKLLLEARAEVDGKCNPLSRAAEEGHDEVVKLLLEARAEVDAKNTYGQTPLSHAAEDGHDEVVKLLLEARAEVDAKNTYGRAPLLFAATGGRHEVAKLLLEARAEVDVKDQYERTPLSHAAHEVAKLLLEARAEVDVKDIYERTPLSHAAREGRHEVAKLLLEARAEVDMKDRDERTPLSHAAGEGRHEVAKLLLEARAEVDMTDRDERTPLGFAIKAAKSECVDIITDEVVGRGKLSSRLFLQIIAEGNQDLIMKVIEKWPQEAKLHGKTLDRAALPERLRPVLDIHYYFATDFDHFDLSHQNLFWAPEVQVTLRYLPGVSGSDALSKEVLKSLADTPHDGIFETDAVEAMILAAWLQYRAFTLLEIGACIMTVVCLCFASYEYRHGPPVSSGQSTLFLVAIFHMKKSIDELSQLCRHFVRSCMCQATGSYVNFDNLADAMYIVAGWFAIIRQLSMFTEELEKPWMAIFSAMAWLRLLYSLRGETWMGPRLLPILAAIRDTFVFFMLMGICIASAVHAYYNLQVRQDPTPTYAAVLQVVRLGVFGDFDLFEFEGLDPIYRQTADNVQELEPIDPDPGPDYVWVHILFYTVGVGITVLLMNVLIGVLSANYDLYEDQSAVLFLRARVKMLVDLQARPGGNLFQYCCPVVPLSYGVPLLPDKRGSCRRCNDLLLFLCVSPLSLILALRFAGAPSDPLVKKLRFKYLSIVVLVLSPLIFAFSLSTFIAFLLCGIFFRYRGLSYTLSCALGVFGCIRPVDASECDIFFVVRDEPAGNDVRSLRKDLKKHIDVMQGSLQGYVEKKQDVLEQQLGDTGARQELLERQVDNVMLHMQKGFAQMDEKIEKLTRPTISEPKGETP